MSRSSQPHDPEQPHSGDEDAFANLARLLAPLMGEDGAKDAVEALRASGLDPASLADAGMLPDLSSLTPAQVHAMAAQMQQMMVAASADGGTGANWTVGRQVAAHVVAAAGDPVVTAGEAQETIRSLMVADLWLDAVTDLDPAPGSRQAWSRSQWVERTMETWADVCAPVAQAVVAALSAALRHQTGELPADDDVRRQVGALGGMMETLSSSVFGMQLGHAIGQLATQAVSATDVGLPLSREPGTVLLPAGVADFAAGLDTDVAHVRAFLAVREAAAARLYAHVPWLRSQVLEAVTAYAREIRVDTDAIEQAVRDADVSDPEALREAMSAGVFASSQSPAQKQALERLETLLALVEGWIEVVSSQALAAHVPEVVALAEMWRRRRLHGGSAERVFAQLIGLELRPRRVREAVRVWTVLGQQAGAAERDALWRHPDVMPTAAELDAPEDFLALRQAQADLDSEIDADLASLLDGTLGYTGDARRADGGTDGGTDGGPDNGPDSGPDGGTDGGADSGPDGGTDGGADSGPDGEEASEA